MARKVVLIDGYVRGKKCYKWVCKSLGIDPEEDSIYAVPFQYDGGWQMHMVLVDDGYEVHRLWPIYGNDEEQLETAANAMELVGDLYDETCGDQLPKGVRLDTPILKGFNGEEYLLVGAIQGMDYYGIEPYEC